MTSERENFFRLEKELHQRDRQGLILCRQQTGRSRVRVELFAAEYRAGKEPEIFHLAERFRIVGLQKKDDILKRTVQRADTFSWLLQCY